MRTLLRLLGFIVFILIIVGVARYFDRTPVANPDPNHTHADFAVWINGKKWDFAQVKYMSGKSTDDHSALDDGDKDEHFHMHDGNGDVVHSHKPDLPISEFFTSLGWTLTSTCVTVDTGEKYCNEAGDKKWRMFVNAKEQVMNPHYSFKDLDKILFTYGSNPDVILYQIDALSDDACLYSKTCPWRGPAPTENCIADPSVPCKE